MSPETQFAPVNHSKKITFKKMNLENDVILPILETLITHYSLLITGRVTP